MVDESKIDLLTKLHDLCTTIEDGVDYLAENQDNVQVKEDIKAGAAALKSYLSDDSEGLLESFDAVLSTSPLRINELRLSANKLSNALDEAVSKAIVDTIKESAYITKSIAEKIFNFFDCASHTNAFVYQMLFDACAKSSVSAPKEAFEYTMKLLEEQPGILSGEAAAHPGYVYRPSEQQTFDRCPICGGEGIPYYRALSYFMSDFSYPDLPVKLWMKCNSCKNLYTWKFPREYLEQSKHQQVITPRTDRFLSSVMQANGGSLSLWGDILNRLRAYSSGNTLLEVGVGRGELISVALEMEYEVDAVEINVESAQAVSDMLNIPVFAANFLEFNPHKTYSYIIMGDVIEHVADPEAALKNAYQLLDVHGVLWLSTPNSQSSFSRMMKFNDPMWMEPHHVTYFYGGGLRSLAEKCGFVIREYSVSHRYNGSMELILTKKPPCSKSWEQN